MIRKQIQNLPKYIVVIYISLTLLIYQYGPFQWETTYPLIFWSLNIAYLIVFIAGWNLGHKIHVSIRWVNNDDKTILHILRYAITINAIYELANAFRKFGITSVNFSRLLYEIKRGLFNMGAAYSRLQSNVNADSSGAFGGLPLTLFNLIWAFATYNVIILGVIYYKQLSTYNKSLLIGTLSLIILEYLATGTNIGFFRIILVLLVIMLISFCQKKPKEIRKTKGKMLIIAFAAVIIILVVFNKTMQSRGGIRTWNSGNYNVGGVGLNYTSVLFRLLPSSMYMIMISLSSYLTQGYYGMSLSLTIPWEPGFGIGYSKAIQNLLDGVISVPHLNSYHFRLTELGWDETVRWHTMYSWFANDITYIGVIAIMFIFGMVFSVAFRDAVIANNPYAKLLVYYFSLMALFIPCNNQIFQSTYIMFSFLLAIVLWLCTRGHKKIRLKCGI